MLVAVVILAVVLVAAFAFSVVLFMTLEDWRVACLIAERERNDLRRRCAELEQRLAAYERITDITALTRLAIRRAAQ